MKRLITLTGAVLLLLSTTHAATDQTTFINEIHDAIYVGSRSGNLTKREVRILHNELNNYEKTLWKYESNGKLSRREKKKLKREEVELIQKLEVSLKNQERVRGTKKKGKAKANKAKKGKKNNRPICRMPSKKNKKTSYSAIICSN